MGLTNWKHSPDGRILKSDVIVAKNYLSEKEIQQLERTVTGYFDYIEGLIERENTFTMESLAKKGKLPKLQLTKKLFLNMKLSIRLRKSSQILIRKLKN